jgi:hypothetical protein
MRTTTLALTLGLALVLACDGEGGKKKPHAPGDAGNHAMDAGAPDGGQTEDDAGELDAGTKPAELGTVQGRVTYAGGTAVGQVSVTVGKKNYQSDSRGVFVARDVPKGVQSVTVEDRTTSAGEVKVVVKVDKASQVDVAVLPLRTVAVPDVQKAGDITDTAPDGTAITVTMPTKALKKKNGDLPVGAGEMKYGLVKQNSDVKAAPGSLKTKKNNQEVQLETFGMIDLRFYQGEELLTLAQAIDVTLPLGPNAFVQDQEVDVYSFDPLAGYWQADGKAKVDKSAGGNGVAKVTAKHLSWWGIAQPVAAESCLSGKVLAGDGKPLADLSVSAVGTDYWGSTTALSGADGTFCIPVKAGTSSTVSAFGTNGASYFEWSQAATAGATAALCGGAGCTDVGTLTGTSLFDECKGDVTHDQNHVLLLTSGLAELDTALSKALEGYGHTVTLGADYTKFDGTLDLSPYDAIYLQANYNWSAGDMPVAGQRQLINWVNCGGGLLTVEWTTWKIGSEAFQLIDAIFPAARTTSYASPTMETYSQVTPDATINKGLPDMFTFTTTNYNGVESDLNPRPGAVIYYDSMMQASGVLGWQYNLGRVASFSTVVGVNEVADKNFTRLLANVLDWVQRD